MRLAGEKGVAHFGKLLIDGTKVRASASMRKATNFARMLGQEQRLRGEIEAMLEPINVLAHGTRCRTSPVPIAFVVRVS